MGNEVPKKGNREDGKISGSGCEGKRMWQVYLPSSLSCIKDWSSAEPVGRTFLRLPLRGIEAGDVLIRYSCW